MYYLVFSFVSLFVLLDFGRDKYQGAIVFLVLWSTLFIFAGLRGGGTANDYFNYIEIYGRVPYLLESFSFENFVRVRTEVAYYFLNALVKTAIADYLYVFMIMAAIAVGLNLLAYVRYSPLFVLSVLIYFSHVYLYREFMQIRAGVACSILLFSIPYLCRRNFLSFSLIVLFGAAFHVASLIFLIVYPFYRSHVRTTLYLGALLFSFFFALVVDIKVVLSFFNALGLLPRPLYLYLVWDKYNYSLGILNPVTVKQFLVCSLLLYGRVCITARVKYFDGMLFLYVISTCWLLIFNDLAILAGRIATFFAIVDPILMASVVYVFKQRVVAYLGVYIFSCMMLILNVEVKSVVNDYRSAIVVWMVD